jgi:hypothetical protein
VAKRSRKAGHRAAEQPDAAAGAHAVNEGPSSSAGLARARAALNRGDVRTARTLAKETSTQGNDRDREEARRLLADLATDPAAAVTALVVLAVIALAAVFALFLRR